MSSQVFISEHEYYKMSVVKFSAADMYQAKISTTSLAMHDAQGNEQAANCGMVGSSSANNPTQGGNGKQRLRWTAELHQSFIDAINQLGGPDSEYFCYFDNQPLISHFMVGFAFL